ncbi:uncharacterized protein LOC144267675 isoform X2 [Eretmochelys imbricata]
MAPDPNVRLVPRPTLSRVGPFQPSSLASFSEPQGAQCPTFARLRGSLEECQGQVNKQMPNAGGSSHFHNPSSAQDAPMKCSRALVLRLSCLLCASSESESSGSPNALQKV